MKITAICLFFIFFYFSFSCLSIDFPITPKPGQTSNAHIAGETFSLGFQVQPGWDSLQLMFNPNQIEIEVLEVIGSSSFSINYYYGKNEKGISILWLGNAKKVVDLAIKILKPELIPVWYDLGGRNVENTFMWFLGIPSFPPICQHQCSSGDRQSVSDTGFRTCVLDTQTGCEIWGPVYRCPFGAVSVNGFCVHQPSSIIERKIKVGEWELISTGLNELSHSATFSIDPNQWEIKDVKIINEDTTGYSINYSGIWKEGKYIYTGFILNKKPETVYFSFLVKPKTNGFLKIHWEIGRKENVAQGNWVYEAVSDVLPGAPAKNNPGTGGKYATTWGGIKKG